MSDVNNDVRSIQSIRSDDSDLDTSDRSGAPDEADDPALHLWRDDYDGDEPLEDRVATLRRNLEVPVQLNDGRRPTYRLERDNDGQLERQPDPDGELIEPTEPVGFPLDTNPLVDAASSIIPLDWTADAAEQSVRLETSGEILTFSIHVQHGLVTNRALYYADLAGAIWLGLDGAADPLVEVDGPDIDNVTPGECREAIESVVTQLRFQGSDPIQQLRDGLDTDAERLFY